MGKEEIACYKQFLLFPQCFQKAFFPGASKGVIVWDGLTTLKKKALIWKHGNQHFLLFFLSQTKFQFFGHICFVACKCFQFGSVLKSVVW